jgi:hypothetical protein
MTTEALAKRYCRLNTSKKWAAHRQDLWSTFYNPSKSKDEIISNVPNGVDPIQWAHFVNYRLKPETQVKLDYFDRFIFVNHIVNLIKHTTLFMSIL